MPARDAKSVGRVGCSIWDYSHGAKFPSTVDFRMAIDAADIGNSYDANMPRKSTSQSEPKAIRRDWFLQEWMRTLKVSQAKLAKECDWQPSTMHGIYHGRTAYYREIVNLIADKLNIEPYELLIPPSIAFALRRQRADAVRIAEDTEPLRRTGTAD